MNLTPKQRIKAMNATNMTTRQRIRALNYIAFTAGMMHRQRYAPAKWIIFTMLVGEFFGLVFCLLNGDWIVMAAAGIAGGLIGAVTIHEFDWAERLYGKLFVYDPIDVSAYAQLQEMAAHDDLSLAQVESWVHHELGLILKQSNRGHVARMRFAGLW